MTTVSPRLTKKIRFLTNYDTFKSEYRCVSTPPPNSPNHERNIQ